MPLLLRSSYAPVFIDYGNLLMYMPQIEIHKNFVDHSMQFCSILFRPPLFFILFVIAIIYRRGRPAKQKKNGVGLGAFIT